MVTTSKVERKRPRQVKVVELTMRMKSHSGVARLVLAAHQALALQELERDHEEGAEDETRDLSEARGRLLFTLLFNDLEEDDVE